MPVVDLDDELSIVKEGPVEDELEAPPTTTTSLPAVGRMGSADESEQQWIVDGIPNSNAAGFSSSRSETDDDSLYLMDVDDMEKPIATPKTKLPGGKSKSKKKTKPTTPSQDDSAYKQYMDVSGIVDNFGEEETKEGWRKKVPSLLNGSNKAKDNVNKSTKAITARDTLDGDDKNQQAKESWRNKNPFRGKARKSTEAEASNEKPAEANLAPLGNIDDVPPVAKEEVQKQEAGWMPKMSSFLGGKSKVDEPTKEDQFEDLYAANLAPLGGVDDLETSVADDQSCSEMTAVVSNKSEEEPAQGENAEGNDESVDVLEKSLGFAMSVMASLNIETNTSKKEQESVDKGEDVALRVNDGTDDIEESEGEFIGANDIEANDEEYEDDMALVGFSNVEMGSDGEPDVMANGKKTWKSKVKSVRKKSGLSSLRKKSSKFVSKNFTQEKMKAMEKAGDDKTIETLETKRSAFDKKEQDGDSVEAHGPRWRKRAIIGSAVALLFLIVIIVAVTVSSSRDDSPPPKTPEYLFKLLYPISGDSLQVQDPESPLVKSFVWTAEDSKARPSDPDSETILRYVSAVVYFSLGGESWTNQNNFLSANDLCMWNDAVDSGIFCKKGISEMKLSNNNLSGEIPDEIRHLTSLRHVVMANNTITGTLPSAIGELGWLEVLDLSSNSMTGFLPENLFTYNQLREIIVSGNNFGGEINPLLGDSPVLERFSAFGNSFYGSLPASIGSSLVLKTVDFTDNDLTGPIPSFSSSSTLERLYLGMNNLDGSIPESLTRLPSLHFLHLQQNALVGTIPLFSNQGSLRCIELSANDLEGNFPKLLESLPTSSLEKIQVSDTRVTGTLPSSIGDFVHLKELHLARNNIEGPIPVEMGKLEKMFSLRLRMNKLTGTIPDELGALALLKDLLLDSNELEGTIPEAVANLPLLDTLILSENNLVGGTAAVCARDAPLSRFAVNTCGDTTVDCPCCNVCCTSEPQYQCFKF